MATDPLHQGLAELAKPSGAVDLTTAVAPLSGPRADQYQELVEDHHLVAALVDALERSGRTVSDDLALLLAEDQAARLQIRRTTEMVRNALGDHVPWVVIKGPSIAAVMARPELRTYNDLDLLVPGPHLRTAIDRLCQAGMVELNQNWAPYLKYRVGEVPMAGFRTTIDVHWDPIALGRTRRAITFDVPSMVERRRSVSIEGLGPLPVLDPVDQLLQVAVHCGLSGATRYDQFRDLSTLAELLADHDWELFTQRARAVGGARLVAHTLDRADLTVGVAVPPGLIDDLGGRATMIVRRRIDRLPLGRRRFVVDCRRDRRIDTVRAFVLKTAAVWPRTRRGGWDFADENSRLYYRRRSGGPDGRQAFLAMAAQSPGPRKSK